MNWIKKLASYVLSEELKEQNDQVIKLQEDLEKREQEIVNIRERLYGNRVTVVPKGAMLEIIRILPRCSDLIWGRCKVEDLKNMRGVFTYQYGCERKSSVIRIVPTEVGKKGLTFLLEDFDLKIFIPIECFTWVGETTCWVWDIYKSNIRIVSDEDFDMIVEFQRICN